MGRYNNNLTRNVASWTPDFGRRSNDLSSVWSGMYRSAHSWNRSLSSQCCYNTVHLVRFLQAIEVFFCYAELPHEFFANNLRNICRRIIPSAVRTKHRTDLFTNDMLASIPKQHEFRFSSSIGGDDTKFVSVRMAKHETD